MYSCARVRAALVAGLFIVLNPDSTNAAVDSLPTLDWFGGTVPHDWLNVKTGCASWSRPTVAALGESELSLGAVGDGVVDDTAAIQACFDLVSNETKQYTVYLPAGTYKVTRTLQLFRGLGVSIIGQGEPTKLVWAGEQGGRLMNSDGLSRSRFIGLVFDGADTAAVGFEHDSHAPGLFETRIRHQNNKFVNFLTAGIRIGHNRTGHKLETSEVLYENCVFANIGIQDSVAFNCTKMGNCGGVLIQNFNDYDNAFDGCHFFNNSWGINTGLMANVYVRNSRFEHNGLRYKVVQGPAIYSYEGADIALDKSAGNSVRRCVSVNSTAFVASPGSETASPTFLEGNVIDSWRGNAAIRGGLRGPYLLIDNSFTNGSGSVAPYDPYCPYYESCGKPMQYTVWEQTNGIALFSGNTIDGDAVDSSQLLPCFDKTATGRQKSPTCASMTNVDKRDLHSTTGNTSPPKTNLTPATRFLKSTWPVPTSLVDARDHGCTGTEKDSTACVQATINAAAAKGGGAAAYFAPRDYMISQPIRVKAGHYTVLGGGVKTRLVWQSAQRAEPAVVVVDGGNGLRLMHFEVTSGGKEEFFDTKVLHDGSSSSSSSSSRETMPSAGTTTVYDEIYTSVPGGDVWNATGFKVSKLQAGDTVHFIHLDGNLHVEDSGEGTVFLNFMIQGSLNISGEVQPAQDRPYPSVGAVTVVGLTDHDINVMDDQSVVITDYYSEQIKTGHLTLQGSGQGERNPGRVTISAVKSNCYTTDEITVDNYYGSLIYASSLFFEGPAVSVTQTGTTPVNITLLANAFNGSSPSEALQWNIGSGASGRNSAIGNLVPCMNCIVDRIPGGNASQIPRMRLPDITADESHGGVATTNGTIKAAIDDWRKLGLLDLLLNHPDI